MHKETLIICISGLGVMSLACGVLAATLPSSGGSFTLQTAGKSEPAPDDLRALMAFLAVSMFNQHAKWLKVTRKEIPWRRPIASLNYLLTSHVWRQDHNGFSHQDPGLNRFGRTAQRRAGRSHQFIQQSMRGARHRDERGTDDRAPHSSPALKSRSAAEGSRVLA